jgi:SAM-dependent methyltransferase
MSGVFQGQTIYRILLNERAQQHLASLSGSVLDLAGDSRSSYRALIPAAVKLTTLNVRPEAGEVVGDFNESLPFRDGSFDSVLLFNALYIAEDANALMREMRRVLKPGGRIHVTSPYISNEMRDPHDYQRFTGEGLERLAHANGLRLATKESFGERGSAAAYLLDPILLVAPIRLVAYSLALLIDHAIPRKVRELHPAPLGYYCIFAV